MTGPAILETASEPPAIEFRQVSLSFDSVPALDNISFKLPRGRMMFITGDSASGKSVLLRLAIGLLHPDSGEIFVNGREIEKLDEDKLLTIRGGWMGLVFQEDALFSGMSTYDNTAYRLIERGCSEEEIDRAVREILQFVGLQDAMAKLPEELSGGMKRRLEIARALVGWPSIMLYDEPTSGLDPINARHILDLIIRARDLNRISSLFVTKALQEISYLESHGAVEQPAGQVQVCKADMAGVLQTRIMVLEEGRIAFFGTPPEFEASTAMAVLRLTHPERK